MNIFCNICQIHSNKILTIYPMPNNISHIIEQIKKGNKLAFSQLFRLYYPKIFSFIFQFLKDKQLTEEITQDVFMRLWINRENLNLDLSFDSYMFTIAKNIVLNYFKKKEVEQRYIDHTIQVFNTAHTEVEEYFYFKDLLAIIEGAVNDMPSQQQKVFRLSREEGLMNAEIAKKLGISKRTVEKHISSSLKFLRKVIEKNYLFFFL
ncbi:RNA polymerase sigma-70 factor [Bacteroides sp. AM07-16]|nr:RNA polymerase sigma-70 factor [Bacteroides sp. AM07-16]